MAEKLSGATLIIIIAGGILILILLFIFVKRQIMRFALRSRRGPHVPIGHDFRKTFRREIERRIDVIPKLVYNPKLCDSSNNATSEQKDLSSIGYRYKTIDGIKLLEEEIVRQDKNRRNPTENLRSYLMNALEVPINNVSQKTVHQFCDLYEHARFDPNEFTEEDYKLYSKLLAKLIDGAKMIKFYNNTRKFSPSKPIKRNSKMTLNITPEENNLCKTDTPSKTLV